MLILVNEADGSVIARHATLRERLRSRLLVHKLDRELARGACPDASAELALRARALVRVSMRRTLAKSVESLLADAARPRPSRRTVPVCCQRVREASAEFHDLIYRLLMPGPLPARGMAQVRILLTDGSGPLYHFGNREDLRARVHGAVEALEPLSSW
jgi:hypothetical protein